MFVPPRYENKLQLISVSFPKNLLSRGIPVRNDVLDLDIQLLEDFFVLNQWKGLLAWTGSFRIFGDNLWAAVSNVEASNTRLVKTFHQDFLIWLLNLSSCRKSLTRTVFWWEKSYQTLLLKKKLDVALRQNQLISAFFDGSQCFWYAVAVARSDGFVHLWLLIFVPPRSENNLQLVSVSFPKNLLSRGIPDRNDVLDLDIQFLEDFFVLNQWKGLLAWTGSFRIFGDNLWGAVSNDEASNTRLVKTFHQDFLIWLLNLSSWRKYLTRTVFWWEKSYQTLLLKNDWMSPCGKTN